MARARSTVTSLKPRAHPPRPLDRILGLEQLRDVEAREKWMRSFCYAGLAT